jgi:hypothetical protein
MRKKYQLPAFAKLENINIDLERLRHSVDLLASNYVDVMTANPKLCDYHPQLVNSVYDNFEQINLTEHNGKQPLEDIPTNVRDRIKRNRSAKEEGFFNKPTKEYTGSYFEEIVSQFSHTAMRVRITKLAPGKQVPLHIDYDPSYATRIIIPVYSNHAVVNKFVVKKESVETYFEPGSAWFLNTGFAHGVFNNSDQPRIALMFSIDGQDDLVGI